MQFLPTTAWLRMVACIPMRLLSPTVQPWTMALWPTVTFFAQNDLSAGVAVEHGVVLHIAVLAQYQCALVWPAVQPRTRYSRPCPVSRRPSTVAFAATKTAPSSRGIFPPKESIIVEKPPFSFASFMVFFIIALIVGARKPPGFRRSIKLCSFIPLRGGFWLWS